MKITIFAFLMGLGIVAPAALAHHGDAAFDTSSKITMKGTVTDFHYTNPHCVIDFDVKDDKGAIQSWQGELSSASNLAAKGWTAATLQEGMKITVTGYKAKSGVTTMRITKLLDANGKEIQLEYGN